MNGKPRLKGRLEIGLVKHKKPSVGGTDKKPAGMKRAGKPGCAGRLKHSVFPITKKGHA